jgi:hypothetical protein
VIHAVVVLRHVPKGGEQLRFVHARDELDRAACGGFFLEIVGGEKDLPA